MEDKPNPIVLFIIVIIVICSVISIYFYFSTPRIVTPKYDYFQVTFVSHGIKHYTLELKSGKNIDSYTITEDNYTLNVRAGSYRVEACFYDINGNYECEAETVYVDRNMTVDLFEGGR